MLEAAPIVVVSGLPRGGTSLVMQMLGAGGLPLLFDDARPADADNPRGYYEFEPVKRLREDQQWAPRAVGKAVKVVGPLLSALPRGYAYWILHLERDLTEIVRSQASLLQRRGRLGAGIDDAALVEVYRKQQAGWKAFAMNQPGWKMFHVKHSRLLESPAAVSREMAAFLRPAFPDLILNEAAMAACVEPRLYRQRQSQTAPSSVP